MVFVKHDTETVTEQSDYHFRSPSSTRCNVM